ncbi:MAG: Cna B-type domain-containing protein [Erysipelotrichaceae bacterium]|nr:Cna B-type domain-containing protein [Erysipelotrichaceae bacterium]
MSISGKKIWDDGNNQDAKRPESIKINLLADGVKINSVTVGANEGWKWSFENLYKSNAGSTTDIVYTIAEEAVKDYSTTVDGYNVTNSYTPSKTSVQVTKAWVGKVGTEVTIKLFADKSDTGKTLTLNADNSWTGSFTELDVNKEGKPIVYTVEEVPVDGYNTIVTGNATEGFVITNTQKTYAIGDYTWVDTNRNGIQDANEPVLEGVIVELYDKTGTTKIAETTTDKNGKYIFDELEAGEYKVKFTLTKEQAKKYRFTKQNSGDDSTVDSDADPVTGWTAVIKLDDDNAYLTTDYEDQEFSATEGIDPTWDAGVIIKDKPIEPEKPATPSTTEVYQVPNTSTSENIVLYSGLIVMSFVLLIIFRKKIN